MIIKVNTNGSAANDLVDLAFRFGVSRSAVTRYVTTWICFLYHHLKELDWMPSVEQVAGTLPSVFHAKYPSTFAMVVKYLWRHQQIFICNHQRGVATNIIILLSF